MLAASRRAARTAAALFGLPRPSTRPRRQVAPKRSRRHPSLRRTPPHARNMHAFLEVVGSGQPDTSSSLQLFFDEARYLFECGDGTQRLCTEHAIKLGKLRCIMLSSLSAPSLGGLFGLILTVADAGMQSVSIAGPSGLVRLFRDARSFYHRPALGAKLTELDLASAPPAIPIPVLADAHVNVTAVPILARRDTIIDVSFGGHYDTVSYVARLRDLRGKFDPAAAIRLGVPKGRAFGLLQRGENVTTPSGATVRPSDVMAPDTPGPVVLVIACPSKQHLRSLIVAPALRREALNLTDESSAVQRRCIVAHLAPREVLTAPEYREWADALGDGVVHIPLHSSVSRQRVAFASQTEDIELLHSTVDPELFPLPHGTLGDEESLETDSKAATENKADTDVPGEKDENVDNVNEPESELNHLTKSWKGQWVEAETRLRYTLSPASNVGLDKREVRPRFVERKTYPTKREWRDLPDGRDGEVSPSTRMATPDCIKAISRGTAALRFFGTGASLPGKYRNVSATMVDLFARGGVLLDCGEGTWGQMARQFGPDVERAVMGLRVIFISHMHADHHLGLPRLLHERAAMLRETRNGNETGGEDGLPQLVVIGPSALADWLEGFQAAARVPLRDRTPERRRPFRFCDARSLTDPQTSEAKFFADAFGLDFGCVEVDHCADAFGVVVRDCVVGWSLVYSGDTRPCVGLAQAGRGATIAIHEATLEDDMTEEALDKKHCTMGEAIQVCADEMGAWRTVLTHFSQRYPRIPKMGGEVAKRLRDGRAAVAMDLMHVDFTRLEELPRVVPALRDSFPEEYPEEADAGAEQCDEANVEEANSDEANADEANADDTKNLGDKGVAAKM